MTADAITDRSVPDPAERSVIDLTAGRTRVRITHRHDAFASLDEQERTRLLVRVLCELVAYDEPLPAPSAATGGRVARALTTP